MVLEVEPVIETVVQLTVFAPTVSVPEVTVSVEEHVRLPPSVNVPPPTASVEQLTVPVFESVPPFTARAADVIVAVPVSVPAVIVSPAELDQLSCSVNVPPEPLIVQRPVAKVLPALVMFADPVEVNVIVPVKLRVRPETSLMLPLIFAAVDPAHVPVKPVKSNPVEKKLVVVTVPVPADILTLPIRIEPHVIVRDDDPE